MYFDDMEKYKV